MNIFPVQNVSHNLISLRMITVDDDEEIKGITRTKDKASFVLKKISRSLEVGLTRSFYKLLTIMEEHGGDAAILATEIQNELVKYTSTESHRPGKACNKGILGIQTTER